MFSGDFSLPNILVCGHDLCDLSYPRTAGLNRRGIFIGSAPRGLTSWDLKMMSYKVISAGRQAHHLQPRDVIPKHPHRARIRFLSRYEKKGSDSRATKDITSQGHLHDMVIGKEAAHECGPIGLLALTKPHSMPCPVTKVKQLGIPIQGRCGVQAPLSCSPC